MIILANTRELIRQIYQVMQIIGQNAGINMSIGEAGTKLENVQILITVPGFLKNKMIDRKFTLDLSELKMVVYDEADELFI